MNTQVPGNTQVTGNAGGQDQEGQKQDAPPAAADNGGGAGGAAAPAWLDGLTDDHRQFMAAKGFEEPKLAASALIDGWRGAEKLLGVPKEHLVQVPTDPDKLFEWDGWDKLGVPKDADGFKIERPKLPDGMAYDEGLEKAVVEAAVKTRIHPKQVQALVNTFAANQSAAMEAYQAQAATQLSQDKDAINAALKQDGMVPDDALALANQAARALGLMDKVGDISLLDHFAMASKGDAAFVKALVNIGKKLGEDELVGKNTDGFDGAGAAAAQIARMKADGSAMSALTNKADPQHKEVLRKWQELHKAAAGED